MSNSQGAYRHGQLAQPRFFRSSLQHRMSCSRPNGAKNANEKTITETCQRKSAEKVQLCILVGSKSGSEVRMLGALSRVVAWSVRYAHIKDSEKQGRQRRAMMKSARMYFNLSDDLLS
jgi:hypothetical protein